MPPRHPRATRALVVALAALLAVGCGTGEQEEVSMGEQAVGQIETQLPIVADPVAERYLTEMGTDIARHTSRPDLPWRFRIVNSPDVNAFAVPGGFIYVNRGLIERAATESELAGVLGHEIGHVTQRHSVRQMEKAGRTNVGLTLLCTLTRVCESGVARVAIDVAGQAWFAKHSRADEAEADSVGVEHVIAAGISPVGIPIFFERLLEERRARPGALEGWFASHPLEEDRIVAVRRQIDEIDPRQLEGLLVDTPHYQAFRARVRALPPSQPPRRIVPPE